MNSKFRSNKTAFTLVEIMIVVAIIGLLAALALSSFQKARRQSQRTAFMEEVRIIEGALHQYAADHRAYPADQNDGIMPPELASYLPKMDWSKPTPLGGQWDYCGGVWSIKCGIGLASSGRGATEMAEIDAILDDGNLNTGNFILRQGQYVQIIEP